jgi:hypothetical protein
MHSLSALVTAACVPSPGVFCAATGRSLAVLLELLFCLSFADCLALLASSNGAFIGLAFSNGNLTLTPTRTCNNDIMLTSGQTLHITKHV